MQRKSRSSRCAWKVLGTKAAGKNVLLAGTGPEAVENTWKNAASQGREQAAKHGK